MGSVVTLKLHATYQARFCLWQKTSTYAGRVSSRSNNEALVEFAAGRCRTWVEGRCPSARCQPAPGFTSRFVLDGALSLLFGGGSRFVRRGKLEPAVSDDGPFFEESKGTTIFSDTLEGEADLTTLRSSFRQQTPFSPEVDDGEDCWCP